MSDFLQHSAGSTHSPWVGRGGKGRREDGIISEPEREEGSGAVQKEKEWPPADSHPFSAEFSPLSGRGKTEEQTRREDPRPPASSHVPSEV